MKKIVILLILVIIIATTAPFCEAVAFADNTVTVRYFYDDTLIVTAQIENGTTLENLLSRDTLTSLLTAKNITVPSGGVLRWRIMSESGEYVALPYVCNNNVDFYACIESADTETVIYSYVYDYKNPDKNSVFTQEYAVGSTASIPQYINDVAITDIYQDCQLTHKSAFSASATQNQTYYVKLDCVVNFKVNGIDYSCPYGTSISNLLKTDTHIVACLYLDNETKERFMGTAMNGLDLTATFSRTHYRVTQIYSTITEDVLIPVDNPVFTAEDVTLYAPKFWYFDAKQKESAALPITLSDDITLYGGKEKTPTLGTNEIIALCVTGGMLAVCGVATLFYKRAKRKKKA